MHARSLINIQTLVATVVFTLGFSVGAGAQITAAVQSPTELLYLKSCRGTPVPPETKESCVDLEKKAYPSLAGATCEADQKEYLTAFSKIKSISSDKVEYYRNCLNGEATEGRSALVGEGSDDLAEKCETVAKAGCSELEEVGRKDLLTEAQESATKARQAVIDLEQNSKNEQKALSRKMAALRLDQEAGVKSYQLQLDAIAKELDATIKAQDQDLRKKMAELRKQLTAKTTALSAINDGLRAAEMAVASSKFSWEASCRTEAFQKLEAIKAEIKKTKEEQVKSKVQINYAGSNVAGAKKRREAKEKLKQQSEYVNGYKTCLAGASGAGAAAKLKQEEASKALELAKTAAAERRLTIEQEIKDLMADFAAEETANAENKDTIRKQMESKINTANVAYETSVKKANQMMMEFQEDLTDAMNFAQKNGQLALETANTTQMALAAAKLRDECGGGVGSSSAQATRLNERYQAVVDADETRSNFCSSATTTSKCPDLAKICADPKTSRPISPNAESEAVQ